MIKNISNKAFGYLGSGVMLFAMTIATLSVNSACWYIMHQEELPDEAKKLRKF